MPHARVLSIPVPPAQLREAKTHPLPELRVGTMILPGASFGRGLTLRDSGGTINGRRAVHLRRRRRRLGPRWEPTTSLPVNPLVMDGGATTALGRAHSRAFGLFLGVRTPRRDDDPQGGKEGVRGSPSKHAQLKSNKSDPIHAKVRAWKRKQSPSQGPGAHHAGVSRSACFGTPRPRMNAMNSTTRKLYSPLPDSTARGTLDGAAATDRPPDPVDNRPWSTLARRPPARAVLTASPSTAYAARCLAESSAPAPSPRPPENQQQIAVHGHDHVVRRAEDEVSSTHSELYDARSTRRLGLGTRIQRNCKNENSAIFTSNTSNGFPKIRFCHSSFKQGAQDTNKTGT